MANNISYSNFMNSKFDWTIDLDYEKYEKIINNFLGSIPYVVAHEYARLWDLLKSGQPFGAVIKLKDTIETITKFLVLSECAKMIYYDYRTKNEIEILKILTEKKLLLSHWDIMIEHLIVLDKLDETTKKLLTATHRILGYNGHNALEWRNRVLGHGALGYADNDEYKGEFFKFFNIITDYLYDNVIYLSDIVIRIRYMNKNTMIDEVLTGINMLNDHKEAPENSLYISDKSGRLIPLFPFLLFYKSDIFYFDSFSSSPKCLDLISYTLGEKIEIRKNSEIFYVYEHISKIHKICQNDSKKMKITSSIMEDEISFDDEIYLVEVEKLLLENCSIQDSIKVTFLENWLRNLVKKYTKGIFLFQAKAETGKTTAVMQLAGIINNRITISNTTIKAIFINDSTNNDVGYIIDAIENTFITTCDGNILLRQREKAFINRNANGKEAAINFAKYLITMKNKLQKVNRCDKKLLLIIDGIDELSEYKNRFYDFLPSEDLLDNDIYILVTSRTNNEINADKAERIGNIHFTEILDKGHDLVNDYGKMHFDYVKKKLPLIDNEIICEIINISNSSFLMVHLIVFLYEEDILKTEDIQNLKNLNDILIKYIEFLCEIYSTEKDMLVRVLYLLCHVKEEINCRGLSFDIGDTEASFRVIGILQDLRGVISVTHNEENYYSIKHTDLKVAITNLIQTWDFTEIIRKELVEYWHGTLQDITNWDENALYEGLDLKKESDIEEYYQRVDNMQQYSEGQISFLYTFFNNRLYLENEKIWEDVFSHFPFSIILLIMAGGANNRFEKLEEFPVRCRILKVMIDILTNQKNKIYDLNISEEKRERELYGNELIILFCRALSDWREWYSSIINTDEYNDFCCEKSYIHEVYNNLNEEYYNMKKTFQEKGNSCYGVWGYNISILIENALNNIINYLIDFYSESENLKTKSENIKTVQADMAINSVKRLDPEMLVFMDEEAIFKEYELLHELLCNGSKEKIVEVKNKIYILKNRLESGGCDNFLWSEIEREELRLKFKLKCLNANFILKLYEEEDIIICGQLRDILIQQIEYLRKNTITRRASDRLHEAVRMCADDMSNYGILQVDDSKLKSKYILKKNTNKQIQICGMAIQLYENITPLMQNYYLLQRFMIITRYSIYLSWVNDSRISTYLDWYLENKEKIHNLVKVDRGLISSKVKESAQVMDDFIISKNYKKLDKEIYEMTITEEKGYILARCPMKFTTTKVIKKEDYYEIQFNRKKCLECTIMSCEAYNHQGKVHSKYNNYV